MKQSTASQAEECRAALDALDRVLGDEQSTKLYEDLSRALRCLVRLRDDLIEHPSADGRSLDHVNAVLSVMASAEFPLVGVRHQRIKKARDHLAELLAPG